jgi:hypothetical protein
MPFSRSYAFAASVQASTRSSPFCTSCAGNAPFRATMSRGDRDVTQSRLTCNCASASVSQLPGEATAGRHPGLVAYANFVYDGAGAGAAPLFARLPEVWRLIATLAGPVR